MTSSTVRQYIDTTSKPYPQPLPENVGPYGTTPYERCAGHTDYWTSDGYKISWRWYCTCGDGRIFDYVPQAEG